MNIPIVYILQYFRVYIGLLFLMLMKEARKAFVSGSE